MHGAIKYIHDAHCHCQQAQAKPRRVTSFLLDDEVNAASLMFCSQRCCVPDEKTKKLND